MIRENAKKEKIREKTEGVCVVKNEPRFRLLMDVSRGRIYSDKVGVG